jgi:uncharacterized Fe-S center protein
VQIIISIGASRLKYDPLFVLPEAKGMTSNVYFKRIDSKTSIDGVQQITRQLLTALVEREGVRLRLKVPLKVHFGEDKNVTFLKPENYLGIIEWLQERKIESCYMETCVLYGGKRYKRDLHEKTALEHGFTQLPILFADGEHGENFSEVEINGKHFKSFKIGRAFLDFEQLIVLSHFKGHILAGFGGAIKQLGMGYAAKGGKLAIHMGVKPHIVSRKCKQCALCTTRCTQEALVIGKKSRIEPQRCVGCGACLAICPHGAVSIFSFRSILKGVGIGNPFLEKLAEGAYGAQKGKENIYMNFARNITAGCDCEARKMKPILEDFGIFISKDPVAVDKACWDMAKERGKKFRGSKLFACAEKIGLGSPVYSLVELD